MNLGNERNKQMKDIRILTTDEEVRTLAEQLMQKSSVAFDLEMDALHNYREKICLMQVSTDEETVIIDPLTADLAPLAPVLAASEIRKIFHAADYDLRCLKRDYGFAVHGLFDTMISAQLSGEPKIGLADLLLKYFAVKLDKRYQKADWSQRPLSPEMIRYAAEDTRHLHSLAAIMEERLGKLGRLPWVAEECEWLEKVEFEANGGKLFQRFKGAGRLERQQLAALEELLQWRDREAERRNCPHFKVLGNKSILEIVQTGPTTGRELATINGISSRQIDRFGAKLLKCLEKAASLAEDQWPTFPRVARTLRDPEADRILSRLKKWRLLKAAELELDPGVLINNALLEAVSRARPDKLPKLKEIKNLRQWQMAELGNHLVGLLD